ncbi:glycogen/starch/alpha-glucan phosphorylase [Neobacillus sp. NPDC093182]|uniref:glycogen/starch/alpha-glucan phosphorylase n=1 Tax=Neobacillus sp. NPDC093182 TaxID=3364297 RepID=UPI0038298C6E
MKLTKKKFQTDFKNRLHEKFAIETADANAQELFESLGSVIKNYISEDWRDVRRYQMENQTKTAYYFSIEFLPGKMLRSNLLNLGILDVVRDGLSELGLDFDMIAEAEKDMALGNGGLGRLASCFMDSLASIGLLGFGNGIRYKYGLFKQQFINGYQVEFPDDWLRCGNVWEVRKAHEAVEVKMEGNVWLKEDEATGDLTPVYENPRVLLAVPYDTAMVGYENGQVNNLRLWDVEIPESEERKYYSINQRRQIQDITGVLYPDDSTYEGRQLRLVQEYFFTSAGLQTIVKHYLKLGIPLDEIHTKIAVHINDTHPALAVAEFMRLLIDEHKMDWDHAWNATVKTMSYTNHTILQEALEKWPVDMVKFLIPRVYQIIEEIDRRYVEEMSKVADPEIVGRTRIIQWGQVHMAYLAIIGSHSTNGVAKIHSDLLKDVVLHDFYVLFPERFNNKTNGIALRRWSQIANEPMSKVLDETIGKEWRADASKIKLLESYADDKIVQDKLAHAKHQNKECLAAYIKEATGVVVSPNAIFDVQVKRLHAYKRQLLNLLHIIKLYLDLKENPDLNISPRVFIFGAKAAPSYYYAKSVIKVINEVGNIVNNDKALKDKLKVVFLPNYNVSLAEIIVPAADVSEQISLASKEASGTSNMKFMLNGAVTIATLDGANIEIKDAVGDENIVIFGMDKDDVYAHYYAHDYHAWDVYDADPIIKRVVNALVDGTIPNIIREGQEIFDALIKYNDEYFNLLDFHAYVAAQVKIDTLYKDQKTWRKMSLMNTANGGQFSSDDTVKKYAEEIWHIVPAK